MVEKHTDLLYKVRVLRANSGARDTAFEIALDDLFLALNRFDEKERESEERDFMEQLAAQMRMSSQSDEVNKFEIPAQGAMIAFGAKIFGPDDGAWWPRFQAACQARGWGMEENRREHTIEIYPRGKAAHTESKTKAREAGL